MRVTDERLAELIRNSDFWGGGHSPSSKSCEEICNALQELAERRRIDLVLTAMLNDPQYDISIMRGRRFEVILYDTAGEREREVYGDTLHAALAALAGNGEG